MWCNDKRSMMYEVMLLWQWYDSSADSGFRERARARRKFNFWHVMRILCILSTGSNIYTKVGTNPSLLACLSHWTLQYCNFLINNRSILKLNQLKFNLHSVISEFRVVNGELESQWQWGSNQLIPSPYLYYRVSQKKTGILRKMAITGLGRGLDIKVGWVLKNSGNFQFNEHRNFVFWSKNDWVIKAQSWLPSP